MVAGRLAGKRILVVEDEYFIASDLKRALLREEAVVVGPVGQVDKALALSDAEPLDAALLDVNLGGDDSFPLADRLARRAVPCMFVTGYDGWALPDAWRGAPRIAKPFTTAAVLDRLCAIVAAGAPA